MVRPRIVGACVVLAALAITGAILAFFGFAAAVMTGGTALTHLIGLGGALVGGTALVTLLGTGLSPREEEDVARAEHILNLLILATGVLSLGLLIALVAD